MSSRTFLALTGGLLASLSFGGPALADGVLRTDAELVHPTKVMVDVEVYEQVATTTAELSFADIGGGGRAFVFPVPEGATVTGFWTLQGGAWQSATLNPEEPTTVDEVSSGTGTGAVLDACGREHPFVIELPDDAREVRVEYVQVLPYQSGEVTYDYPLAPCAGAQLQPYQELELRLDVTSARPFAGFSAPGFGAMANVEEQSANHVRIAYQATNYLPSEDFRFSYGVEQNSELYVNLLTDHARCGEDGYFLLIVEPVQDIEESAAIPKAFSFVMDVSGSMAGYKIEQVRTAAKFFVLDLNEQDAFNVVCFSDEVDPLFPAPEPATTSTRQIANQFLETQYANGSTDIHRALLTALQGTMAETSARIVVLLTDGQPTSGVVDSTQIVNAVAQANTSHARLFTFGVGQDVNKPLLTALAMSNQGEAHFLSENEDITSILATFYEKIDRPVLTDVSLSFGDVEVYDVLPAGFTDLYAGSQLFVLGRFRKGGDTTGSLSGRRVNETIEYTYPLSFPECAVDEHAFLPCLWAKAKVDALITELMQSGGQDLGKIAEIEQLANRCGLQTPYTSYGVNDDPSSSGGSGGSASGSGGSASGVPETSSGSSRAPGSYRSGDLEVGGCQMGGPPASLPGGLMALLLAAAMVRKRR